METESSSPAHAVYRSAKRPRVQESEKPARISMSEALIRWHGTYTSIARASLAAADGRRALAAAGGRRALARSADSAKGVERRPWMAIDLCASMHAACALRLAKPISTRVPVPRSSFLPTSVERAACSRETGRWRVRWSMC